MERVPDRVTERLDPGPLRFETKVLGHPDQIICPVIDATMTQFDRPMMTIPQVFKVPSQLLSQVG